MTLNQLHELQSLAKQARQEFLLEIQTGKYDDLEKSAGLSRQQIFRLRKGEGNLLFETLIESFIYLKKNSVKQIKVKPKKSRMNGVERSGN